MTKKILIGLAVVLIILQFIRPEKPFKFDNPADIKTKYTVPKEVGNLLIVACNDCHSNRTTYPWYTNVQPIGWWISNHVADGKRHLNFSEFTTRPIAYQNHKFEEIIEMVKEKEMPLPSYTYFGMHSLAKLEDKQRQVIMDWAQAQMDKLKSEYPADSLIMKRRSPPSAQ